MQLEVLPSVWPDFFVSAAWYEMERRGLGTELSEEADATLDRIQHRPSMFPRVRGPVRRAQLQRFPFAVFYEIVGEIIVVYAIVHLGRDENAWTKNIR